MSGVIDTNTTNIIDVYDALEAYEKAVRGNHEGELDRTRATLAELLKRAAVAPPKGCVFAEAGELYCRHALDNHADE